MTDDEMKYVIKQAVCEALEGSNMVDGPTHIAHHQAIEEFLALTRHAKKTAVGAVIVGILSLFLLGVAVWRGQ